MVSLDTLDEEKRNVLIQYQSITQTKDLEDALGQLIEHDWNLEKSVQNIYEKREEAANTSSSNSSNNLAPSQRQPSLFLSILFWPFGIAWNITCSILSLARIISRPSIKNNKPRDPRVLAFEFIESFEAKYGKNHVEFFKGGYSQALEKARRELRFMLVILLSNDHDDTFTFCRDTLGSNEIINFIKEKNILVWAGNVHESEANKVSHTLQASTYPFMALIALQISIGNSIPKMTVIKRIEGTFHSEELTSQINIAIERQGSVVNRLKNERNQRELEHQLLKDQDAAYNQSLKADQEKSRVIQQEKELLAKERHYIQYLYNQLLSCKEEDKNDRNVAKISFRLANGDRIVHLFKKDDTVDTLYRFIQVYPLLKEKEIAEKIHEPPMYYTHKYKFTIHSPYPRMEYEPNNQTKLCDIKSLWPSATLVIDAMSE